jgi:hypothetical protein
MNKKLPVEAFGYYLSLGVGRSYSQVAKKFEVSKRTVTSTAVAEKWQERVAEADAKTRDKAIEGYVETVQQMNDRHLKVMRFMLGRGLEGLKQLPVNDFGAAVRAVTMAVEKERLIRGEATDRTETIEAIVQRENERYLVDADDETDEVQDGDDEAHDGTSGEASSP